MDKSLLLQYDNHRVQVINVDLTYSHFGSRSELQPGQFNHPEEIAIDADGHGLQ